MPNDRVVELRLKTAAPAFNSSANVLLTPLALAVSVAVCAELTAEADAVNPALVALAGTRTVAGTVTEELLLAKATLNPPVGAPALSDTVQASVAAPVRELTAQVSPLRAAVLVEAPVPLRFTREVLPVDESLLIVS